MELRTARGGVDPGGVRGQLHSTGEDRETRNQDRGRSGRGPRVSGIHATPSFVIIVAPEAYETEGTHMILDGRFMTGRVRPVCR